MWKAVETKAGKTGMAKTKRKRGKERGKKETKKEKDDGSKKSSRRMGDLE